MSVPIEENNKSVSTVIQPMTEPVEKVSNPDQRAPTGWFSVGENREAILYFCVFFVLLEVELPNRVALNLALSAGFLLIALSVFWLKGFPVRLYRLIIWLARRGNYDWAIHANWLYMHTPGHGASLEGWILSVAGRYTKALAFYKPQAFDVNGQPLLTSQSLYMYASNLLFSDKKAEAQELFESALAAREQGKELLEGFRLGLANSLLYQDKEAERARQLVAQVIGDRQAAIPSPKHRMMMTRLACFYAYAVASCGERDEALALLKDSMAGLQGLGRQDLADCEHMCGVAWQVLGEEIQARRAFQATLALVPHGDIALRARKRLAELDQKN